MVHNQKQPDTAGDSITKLRVLGIDLEMNSFSSMLDEFPVFLWVHDESNTIVYGNDEFKKNFGTCVKQKCHQYLMGKQNTCCCLSNKVLQNETTEQCTLCKRINSVYNINKFHTPVTNRSGQKFILKSSFIIQNLGPHVKNMYPDKLDTEQKEIYLVMCSTCNRVKDRKNDWVATDNYIVDYFSVRISHGICPDCRVM